jgi:hypothetical protein
VKLAEVFKFEGISESLAACVVMTRTEFVGSRKTSRRELQFDWAKAADGCWYAEDWRFIPAIAKLGDPQGAFDYVGRNGPATPSV